MEGDYENPWYYQGTAFTSDDINDFSVSSTGLLIFNRVNNISVENTSGKNVSLEVVRDGLRLRVTGNDTMEALQNLVQIESYLETLRSNERSYPFIPDSEM